MDVFEMTPQEKQAYEWAINQPFTSVAATNARVLTQYVKKVVAQLHQSAVALDILAEAVGNCLLCSLACLDEDDSWWCAAHIGDEGPECAGKVRQWAIVKAKAALEIPHAAR